MLMSSVSLIGITGSLLFVFPDYSIHILRIPNFSTTPSEEWLWSRMMETEIDFDSSELRTSLEHQTGF
jgi:hypothetical protein